ncbi:MAG: DUF1080 domain-containing protein [Phycisphaerae bacterium]|nr:DUF1080 domain-containing protein [Phycisphaerae bacterium]
MKPVAHPATALAVLGALLLVAPAATGARPAGPTWTTPEKAAAADPDFLLQGEYRGKGNAAQVIALGQGRFQVMRFAGGLPGDGWDGRPPAAQLADAEAVGRAVSAMKRIERKSSTLGAKPPTGATVLFDGTSASKFQGGKLTEDGLLAEGCHTTGVFGDFTLHLEFRLPYKPRSKPGGQDRGNSGVYIFNRYETQVLDSFGLHYGQDDWKRRFQADWGGNPPSDRSQWCGAFYKFKVPDVNMCFPPLAWQTYDIDFTAPRFADGKKVAPARITVRHNGVTIHDNVTLPKGTGAGGGRAEIPKGGIHLQGHGNPVRFRNIWIQPR